MLITLRRVGERLHRVHPGGRLARIGRALLPQAEKLLRFARASSSGGKPCRGPRSRSRHRASSVIGIDLSPGVSPRPAAQSSRRSSSSRRGRSTRRAVSLPELPAPRRGQFDQLLLHFEQGKPSVQLFVQDTEQGARVLTGAKKVYSRAKRAADRRTGWWWGFPAPRWWASRRGEDHLHLPAHGAPGSR